MLSFNGNITYNNLSDVCIPRNPKSMCKMADFYGPPKVIYWILFSGETN